MDNPDDRYDAPVPEFYSYEGKTYDTRSFCLAHEGKFFHFREIMDLSKETWEGKHPDTNEKTIFHLAGGYCQEGFTDETCMHVFAPRSAISVPRQVLLRNIQKGYYKPSNYEKQMLGVE